MDFDKDKALKLAKSLSDKFKPSDVEEFVEKHKDLDFIVNVKLLLNMAVDAMKGKYKISNKTFVTIAGVLAYVVLPTDLIPDFIPGIGFIDDAFVIGWAFKSLADEIENYKRFKSEKI